MDGDGVFTVMQIGIPDFIQFDIIGQRSKSGLSIGGKCCANLRREVNKTGKEVATILFVCYSEFKKLNSGGMFYFNPVAIGSIFCSNSSTSLPRI